MIDSRGWIDPIAFEAKYGVPIYNERGAKSKDPKINRYVAAIPRPGNKQFIPVKKTGNLIIHTTEGLGIASAYNTLKVKHAGTTFVPGDFMVYQTRPIGYQSGTLKAGPNNVCNSLAEVQMEIVEKSKDTLYLPRESSLIPTIACLAFSNLELGIPLIRPIDKWKDDWSDVKGKIMATASNPRRATNLYLTHKGGGVWGHVEVPFNDHHDPYKLWYTELFRLTNLKIAEILAA